MSRLKRLQTQGYDLDFLAATQPVGNVLVKESAVRIGSIWSTCIYVYKLIEDPNHFWLIPFSHLGEGQVTIDVYTQDSDKVGEVLDKAIKNAERRIYQTTGTDSKEAREELHFLSELAMSVRKQIDVLKYIKIRLYVSADSLDELEKKVKNIRKQLENERFGTTICLMEQKEEYQSKFIDYISQQFLPNRRAGLDIASTEFGASLPLNYVSLYDQRGSYLGRTRTFGNFIFDRFELDGKHRTQYNLMLLGQMGFGKSSLMKKIFDDDASKGYLIYGFDKSGEYTQSINTWGGKIIRLDGDGGRINPFEIYPTSTNKQGEIDEQGSYIAHLSKLQSWYSTLKPNRTDEEKNELEVLLANFYEHLGFVNSDGDIIRERITGLAPEAYPTLSDFLNFMSQQTPENAMQENDWHKIKTQFSSLKKVYRRIFDGYTTVPNLSEEQIVFFNIDGLASFSPEIANAQLFMAITLFYSLLVKNGKEQLQLYRTKQIPFDYLRRGSIYIDECHNILNVKNLFLVNYMTTFMREARKLLISIVLATQSLSDFVPEHISSEQQNALNKVFGFCQYVTYFYLSPTELSRLKFATAQQLTDTQISNVGSFRQGQCLFTFNGGSSYEVAIELSKEEQERYDGGGKTHG